MPALSAEIIEYFKSVVEGRESFTAFIAWWHRNRLLLHTSVPRVHYVQIISSPFAGIQSLLQELGVHCVPVQPGAPDGGLTSEEYEVLSLVLRQFHRNESGLLIDQDTTRTAYFIPLLRGAQKIDSISRIAPATLDDYRIRNASSCRLERRFDIHCPYALVDPAIARTLSDDERTKQYGWASYGTITLGRVGFDPMRLQAFAYESSRAPRSGHMRCVFFEKRESKWMIADDYYIAWHANYK